MISPKRAKPSTSASHNLPSSPAETATSNDYLLTEILLRLPVKSLLKFKSVSKHWLSLITSPYFASKHNPRAISGLFFRHPSRLTKPSYAFINISPSPRRAPFTSLNFVHDPFGIRILQSCNGLMLCCSNRTNNSETNYYVYNPTTKQHTVLPELSTGAPGSGSRVILGVNLAFDPIKSPDYKVICLVASSSVPYHYQIEIYSSKTGPWRPCGSPFATPSNVDFGLGVFWNGSIHWPSVWGNSLYFDVDKEQVRELPMPVLPDNDDETFYRCRYFGESGGHLHFMELDISNALHFDVYELEMNYSGWFIKYKVDLNPIAVAFPETIGSAGALDMLVYEFSILAVVRAQTDEDSYLVLQLPHLALRYNFKDGTSCKICDLAPLQHGVRGQFTSKFVCFEAYQFIESLACV